MIHPDQAGDEHSVEALRQQLEETRQECLQLSAENKRLRDLLGLPSSSEPALTPPRELFPNTEILPIVTSDSPVDQKIILFRLLFRGRDDVFAVKWLNTLSGKKGFSPAITGGWRNRSSQEQNVTKNYLPLTDDFIRQHLEGKQTIGVYPLLRDDTCWFLVCDFDGKTVGLPEENKSNRSLLNQAGETQMSEESGWVHDALGYLEICRQHGVPAYLERSQSGMGGHIWMFFSAPIPAVSARRLGTFLLRETMAFRAGLDLTSYDRFFPSQDYLPKGGFGNLIALPLQKHCRALGNTEFLDRHMHPWPDQWKFLSNIKRIFLTQIDELLNRVNDVSAGPGTMKPALQTQVKDNTAPINISCTFGAFLSIEKPGLPPWLISEIKHLASFHNPVFYERQKLRLSTYQTPRFIKCYEEDPTCIHLPRGLLGDLQLLVGKAGSQLFITDLRCVPARLSLNFRGTLTPLQEQVACSMLAHEQGVLVAPPGLGKTVMACFIVAERNVPVLILVHRKPLLDQWRIQLVNMLGLSSKEIGQLGSGKDTRTRIVDLAMIQTLKRLKDPEAVFPDYGLLIVDECHHLPAFSFESCVKRASIRYVLGLTATPYRRDGLQDIIVMQCGPIRQKISVRQSGVESGLTLHLVIRQTEFVYASTQETAIQEVFRALVNDHDRLNLICDDVLAAVRQGARCLVLSEWKEHCRALSERFMSQGITPFVLDGGLRKQARKEIFEAIRQHPSDKEFLLVSTGQYLGEGFDCPQIDTLFLTFPISFKGKLIQYVGRLMRRHNGKSIVLVHDYADVQVPVLKKMFGKRKKTFETLGFIHEKGNQPDP